MAHLRSPRRRCCDLRSWADYESDPRFLAEGAGPTVLLLHGFNGGSGIWLPTIADLVRAGYRCLAPDLPGWGDTPPPPGFSYTMPDLIAWLCAFLDRHGPAGAPVTVLGHSFGGAAALHLALTHPARVAALVLISPAGLSPAARLEYRLLCLPGIGEHMLRPSAARVRRELPQFAVSDLAVVPADVLAYIDRVIMHPWFTATTLNWVRRNGVFWRGAGRISVRERLGELRSPTLLLAGDADPIVDVRECIEAARRIPACDLHVLAGARHLLQLDRRREFAERVLRFLEAALQDHAEAAL